MIVAQLRQEGQVQVWGVDTEQSIVLARLVQATPSWRCCCLQGSLFDLIGCHSLYWGRNADLARPNRLDSFRNISPDTGKSPIPKTTSLT